MALHGARYRNGFTGRPSIADEQITYVHAHLET
jgi:hypothetical protein